MGDACGARNCISLLISETFTPKGVSDVQGKREPWVLELGCKPSMPTKRFSVYIFSESSGIIKSYILLQKQPSVPLCVTIAYTLKKKANNSYSSPPLPPVKHEV